MRTFSLLLALCAGTSLAASAQCYFPNGTPSNDFVCNSTTGDGFSSCCGRQADGSPAYCLSNGLCLSDMSLTRSSCTDKSWNSPNCAQVCTKTKSDQALGIRACGYSGQWDCGDGSGCGKSAVNITTGNLELTKDQLAQMGAVPSSASNAAASPSSGTLTTPFITTQTVTSSPSESGTVSAGIVGAAIGAPLLILALTFLALWLLERRKNAQVRQEMQQQQQQFQQQQQQQQQASLQKSYAPSYHQPSHSKSPSYYQSAPSIKAASLKDRNGISRMASQHSTALSPVSQHANPMTPYERSMSPVSQHKVSRMASLASTNSHYATHVAYQTHTPVHYPNPGAPPMPPNGAGADVGVLGFIAEVPANEVPRNNRRVPSHIQELPVEY